MALSTVYRVKRDNIERELGSRKKAVYQYLLRASLLIDDIDSKRLTSRGSAERYSWQN